MDAIEESYLDGIEKEYYKNLPHWPDFNIFDNHIDGLIPSCRVDSWEKFDEVVKHYCENDVEGDYVFRGQKHYQWQLQPTLDRLSKGSIRQEIAEKQLTNFKLSIRGRLSDKSVLDKPNELWALGQHHGLATPLLDWSASPYVSLFFAFEGEDDPTWVDDEGGPNNFSRIIFILNKTFIQDIDGDDNFKPVIIEPSIDDHGRLVNQAGLFTIAPYSETLESSLISALTDTGIDIDDPQQVAEYICRIHIPNSSTVRLSCLKKLRKMNIHHASLFPDLIGASGFCNDLIAESIAQLENNKPISADSKELQVGEAQIESTVWIKHQLSEDNKAALIDTLLVSDSIKKQYTPKQLQVIADSALDFINKKSVVDWYKRESQLSRFRIIIRRALKRLHFPEDSLDQATNALVSKAKAFSEDTEQEDN